MEKLLTDYLQYMLEGVKEDITGFNHWWMLLILPAVWWAAIIIAKYALLTCPIWLPFRMVFSSARGLLWHTVNKTKKAKRKKEDGDAS
jgi:hypothetical protein